MVGLINHTLNLIFRKNRILRVFPNPVTNMVAQGHATNSYLGLILMYIANLKSHQFCSDSSIMPSTAE